MESEYVLIRSGWMEAVSVIRDAINMLAIRRACSTNLFIFIFHFISQVFFQLICLNFEVGIWEAGRPNKMVSTCGHRIIGQGVEAMWAEKKGLSAQITKG